MGKNIGDDLADGKPTLPLIYALARCNSKEQLMIREAIENKDSSHNKQIIEYIKSCGALALATEKAKPLLKRQSVHWRAYQKVNTKMP
ncbi:MAG: hypothetical protein Ct9H300mP4_12470 [Gammaproteobacteria bacterium]|nr:MAG: hypothetical protein Ct9H300mP4_12470 [Gammaproteobacteria bacterium]